MKKRILILGVGSFAHSMMAILKDAGAEVACYLTREYGHYGARQVGETWNLLLRFYVSINSSRI